MYIYICVYMHVYVDRIKKNQTFEFQNEGRSGENLLFWTASCFGRYNTITDRKKK